MRKRLKGKRKKRYQNYIDSRYICYASLKISMHFENYHKTFYSSGLNVDNFHPRDNNINGHFRLKGKLLKSELKRKQNEKQKKKQSRKLRRRQPLLLLQLLLPKKMKK
jgi:hypothetical protein